MINVHTYTLFSVSLVYSRTHRYYLGLDVVQRLEGGHLEDVGGAGRDGIELVGVAQADTDADDGHAVRLEVSGRGNGVVEVDVRLPIGQQDDQVIGGGPVAEGRLEHLTGLAQTTSRVGGAWGVPVREETTAAT